jgi:hypothetical protein
MALIPIVTCELVSGSMAQCGDAVPWMLKQVQHDGLDEIDAILLLSIS